MAPELSIVFTSYNHKEFLRQAVESLLEQTYRNFELIIIDDCSTDGSQEILLEYENVPNVKLFLRENNSGSYVKASNFGAAQAKGKYLLFAQCDDFAEPQQIQLLMEAFNQHPSIGVSFCRSTLVNENGQDIGDDFSIRESSFRELCKTDTIISGKQIRTFFSKSCVIPNLSAAVIKHDLYLKSGGLSEQYLVAADWAFWLKLSELCDFYYNAKPLNNFRQHKTTIRSTIKIKKQILEIYQLFYNHIDEFKLIGKDKCDFKIGAGAIWLSYISQGPKAWLLSFPEVLKSTFKYEKLNLWYLLLGLIYKTKEFFKRS